ncbi:MULTISPECIES: DUF5692 family protein [unclassified Oceanispirochaeta]|uniref:DUF5692 family protein n=1 Tax=unclassified Oceanispirochaeta TaxID=2635722 RepID=UPI000E094210|nr:MULTISPECIES: DUF5692 family protein [unclassified Oceanispirochaeta]MBF9016023.1 hypothetical protein [Oceanispirochaeta sp. M2]NPD72486.1 hypothetical protein [Oceanispirochaeta sp. M1]RDG31945.1 hypothetical protein DV872_10270 [Oceanispirochaeta sp. M1]
MGLYDVPGIENWAIMLFVLFALMAFNELGRTTKWGGIALFFVVPVVLTIFVWPTTAAPGNEYGTGTWFNWVKTYSALAGCLGFMAIRFIPGLSKKKWALAFPPFILALNIFEACLRDFQCYGFAAWNGAYIDNLFVMSGPWNIINGIAGILNILTICGWAGIIISKDKTKDMIWPDMIWAWIIAYDLWNFSYTYNCIADHSFYCGLTLLLACTIPAFWIKKGAWLQHRASTLAFWIMFVMTVPSFADRIAPVRTTHNPRAFLIVSIVSLAANAALFIYQIYRIRQKKLHPLRDEVYFDTETYKKTIEFYA